MGSLMLQLSISRLQRCLSSLLLDNFFEINAFILNGQAICIF